MEVSRIQRLLLLSVGQQSRGIKGVRKTRTEAADRESTALMEKGGYSLARVAGKRAGACHQSIHRLGCCFSAEMELGTRTLCTRVGLCSVRGADATP